MPDQQPQQLPDDTAAISRHKIILTALAIFFIVLSVTVHSINSYVQLGRMSGLTEEYIDVAKNLLEYGMAYPHDELTYVYRPPGYIFFLQMILRLPNYIPRLEGQALNEMIQRTKMSPEWRSVPVYEFDDRLIFFAQAVLLAASAAILFVHLYLFTSFRTAFVLALAYGLNMYMIIMAGLYHYPILHLFFVVLSCYITQVAFQSQGGQRCWLAVAGILWGIATLVRPMTLILPAFIFFFALLRYKKDLTKAIVAFFIFSLGMALVIAPVTISNYKKTKRFIPVNAQAWTVLWANTVEQGHVSQNHYNWWQVWYAKGMPIYRRVTHEETYNFLTVLLHNLRLEEAFKEEALKNMRARPQVLLMNFQSNIWQFLTHINSVIIKAFQAVQVPSQQLDMQARVTPGASQDFYSPTAQRIFEILHLILFALSLVGIYFMWMKREMTLFLTLLIFGCFVLAQSLTHVGFMHYYVKMPFYYLFAGYGIAAIQQWPRWRRYGRLMLAVVVALELGLITLAM